MAVEVRTDKDLRKLSDEELNRLHQQLHEMCRAARERGEATEYLCVNTHIWVVREMKRRGMHHNVYDELDRETEILSKRGPLWLEERLTQAEDQVLVPAYISLVGSAVKSEEPNDIDVLVREDEERLSKGQKESLYLLVRKVLDPAKQGKKLHMLFNAQGPHLAKDQAYVPLYDLVLRPRKAIEYVSKAAPSMPGWERWLDEAPEGLHVDLGPGDEKPEGFIGVGFGEAVDIPADLDDLAWPLAPESVAVLRANHVLEHLSDPAGVMLEVWRVLKPGGLFIATVPAAGTRGDFAHPEHCSHWSADTFRFYADEGLLETIDRRPPAPFELLHLEERERGPGVIDVDVVLRKPTVVQVEKRALKPITRFPMHKPAMKLYHAQTEAFSPEEIWPWVEKHLKNGVVAEEKLNGFRASIQKAGDKVSIFFEDSQKERNKQLPEIVEALKKIDADFILDANVGVEQNGKPWPRIKLMTLTAEEPELPKGAYPKVTVFDLLYWDEAGGDVHEKPFAERRKLLEEFYRKYLKGDKHFAITDQMRVESKADLERAWKKLGGRYLSEGIVLKDLAAPFELKSGTDGLAKIKHAVEVKAWVLDVKRNKNGTYGFRGGLLLGDAEFTNTVEFKGQEVVDLGWSFNAPFKAEVGDVVTFEVEEIIIREAKDGLHLDWLGAKPIDVDKARSKPYFANQVIDLARRGGVLQEAVAVKKVEGLTVLARVLGVRSAREGFVYRLGFPQPLFGAKGVEEYAKQPHQVVGESLPNPGLRAERGDVVVVVARELRREVTTGRLWLVDAQVLARLEGISPNSVGQVVNQAREKGLLRDSKGNLLKQEPEGEGGETRGEAALRNWEENWYEAMPLSGKALPFILHAHWRGLSEEETELDMDDLLKTNHSLHFDLRLGTDRFDGWWGISLFAGTTEENRKELRIFRMMHDPDEKIQSAPKQFGPSVWLKLGLDKPYVSKPGGVGSTSKTYSKFFAIDHGTWRLGFARQHAVEIWLEGKKLKGRFLWQYAPAGEGRIWLFTRPEDQQPYAKTHDLDEVVDELRRKKQRYLIWPKDPDDLSKGHILIDVTKVAKILKVDEERRYTLAVAYPANKKDAHGDYMTPEELEEAAWNYLRKHRKVGLMHKDGTEGAGDVVESYIYRGPVWEVNGERVEPGDWLLGVIWSPEAWERIKKGEFTGYSIQGWGRKVE